MKTSLQLKLLSILFCAFLFTRCGKSGYLDKKPNSDYVVPKSYADFQAILENTAVMNLTPALGELSADNYYISDFGFYQGLDARQRNAITWQSEIYAGQGSIGDWNLPYQQVFYANVILDGLSTMKTDSLNGNSDWKYLKGAALFSRAYAFYNIASVFAGAYDSSTAATALGIPLRLHSEIDSKSVRASIQNSYQQIINDLLAAKELMISGVQRGHLNRPSRPAVLAMLARVYLSMRVYGEAGKYADSCLRAYDSLQDYNAVSGINMNIPFPSPASNKDIIYESNFITSNPTILLGSIYTKVIIDSNLYGSYATNDLRKRMFYKLNSSLLPILKGGYGGSLVPFSGLATDEVMLIRAECRARAGLKDDALSDLNALLEERYTTDSLVPVQAFDASTALDSILNHRRKELAFRGIRWTDLKRLNKEGRNIILKRVLNGQTYQLLPNTSRYVLPIPPDVISLSGMPNNPRD